MNKHLEFLKELPYFLYYEFENFKPLVVSHSYIHNIWQGADYQYKKNDLDVMIWSHLQEEDRDKLKEEQNNIFNIFGHTIVNDVIIEDNYAMVDTGAFAKDGKLKNTKKYKNYASRI